MDVRASASSKSTADGWGGGAFDMKSERVARRVEVDARLGSGCKGSARIPECVWSRYLITAPESGVVCVLELLGFWISAIAEGKGGIGDATNATEA